MTVPRELLLDILRLLDHNSIVPAKFVNSTFLCLVTQYAEELACQRYFAVLIQKSYVAYADDANAARRIIRYDPGSPASFAEACQRVSSIIGHHVVKVIQFLDNTWNRPYIFEIFVVSAVKYASDLDLYTYSMAAPSATAAFLNQFVGLRSLNLRLSANDDDFHWTLLRSEALLGLNRLRINFSGKDVSDNIQDEIIRYCSTVPHQCDRERLINLAGEALFPTTFVKRLIQSLAISDQQLTANLHTNTRSPVVPDADEFERVVFNGYTVRYASDSSGISVDAVGNYVVIRSTARSSSTTS